jgi:hypothetical protein
MAKDERVIIDTYTQKNEYGCQMCDSHKDIPITVYSNAGIFYENPNRVQILGICQDCDATIISCFTNRKDS